MSKMMKEIYLDDEDLPEDILTITDLYISVENIYKSYLYPGAVSLEERVDYVDFCKKMIKDMENIEEVEFSLRVNIGEYILDYRGHSIDTRNGKIFIFRKMAGEVPDLSFLGINKQVMKVLLSDYLCKGGLVIIAGDPGQGKSTTAASMIKGRMERFGSFCLTIEDPIEMPLEGVYPSITQKGVQGVCYQTSVSGENAVDAIRSSLRCYPAANNAILFLGEIRDDKMANEALKIAANGQLVITTYHGGDLESTLKRFLSQSLGGGSSDKDSNNALFGSVFRVLMHQKIVKKVDGAKSLSTKLLISSGADSGVGKRIVSGRLDMLKTEMESQLKDMEMNKLDFKDA